MVRLSFLIGATVTNQSIFIALLLQIRAELLQIEAVCANRCGFMTDRVSYYKSVHHKNVILGEHEKHIDYKKLL